MSKNLFQFPGSYSGDNGGDGNHTGGGNPPGGDPMEARVTALEKASQEIREKLVRVETKLDHMASKEDLQSVRAQIEGSMRTQLQWFVGLTWTASIALVCVTYFMATHIPK
jgi:hypothetical protein